VSPWVALPAGRSIHRSWVKESGNIRVGGPTSTISDWYRVGCWSSLVEQALGSRLRGGIACPPRRLTPCSRSGTLYPMRNAVTSVFRERSKVDRDLDQKVKIDGHRVGELAPGETVEYRVEPGEHDVVVKRGVLRSKTFRESPEPNERLDLGCFSRTNNSWFYTVFSLRPGGWFELRPLTGSDRTDIQREIERRQEKGPVPRDLRKLIQPQPPSPDVP
jgi:hypothetical protein